MYVNYLMDMYKINKHISYKGGEVAGWNFSLNGVSVVKVYYNYIDLENFLLFTIKRSGEYQDT